jgi:hypothetical protein
LFYIACSNVTPVTALVEAALVEAEQAGTVALLNDLGSFEDVSKEVLELAVSPLAPLAAEALGVAAGSAPNVWGDAVGEFAGRLGMQHNLLALVDALDNLLDSPHAAKHAAIRLHGALLEGHSDAVRAAPLLAAVRLEGALRVALTGAVAPYRVLDRLASPDRDDPDEYLETLPRLIGIALDAWDTEISLTAPLVVALEVLSGHEGAAAGATYELACRQMRAALRQSDPAAAARTLGMAVEGFNETTALDESRDDAAAYAAVCSGVAAFGLGDASRLLAVTSSLDDVLRRRVAWHHKMHEPTWRRPLLDAEVEWLGLVVDLRDAMERLREHSWLESAAAVGQLARVYAAERSTMPAPGLASVVRPTIVNALMENATLLDQLARSVVADRQRYRPALPESAGALLAAIEERRAQAPQWRSATENDTDQEADPGLDARVDKWAPRLRQLGDDIARAIAKRVDDDRLAEIAEIVASATSFGVMHHPTLASMRANIIRDLSENPRFDEQTRPAVIALLDTTLTFLLNRYDRGGPVWPGHPDICRPLRAGESAPLEEDLQLEFHIWAATSRAFAGRADIEQRNVARGRVDVVVRVGDIQLVTEVKRELVNASHTALERQYVAQAAAYSGSNVPFSQLLVLDLTSHSAGVPPLVDLAWVVQRRANMEASPQHVVAAVVVGEPPGAKRVESFPSHATSATAGPNGADPAYGGHARGVASWEYVE